MNFQQLEYILAVDKFRHFAKAAEACFVTQPTLSTMVQKLEEEVGLKIFDRSIQPVQPTEAGEKLLEQARLILTEANRFKEIANEARDYLGGELRVGVIPTVAPYLLPLFVQAFHREYPNVQLKITELITELILSKLKSGELDVGILVPPENEYSLVEIKLYDEAFVAYSPKPFTKEYLLPDDIDANELLLLEEGHCFRSQIVRFCELREKLNNTIEYTSGSLETLRNLADRQLGITILPELATLNLSDLQKANVCQFANPRPQRRVSLLMKKGYLKKKLTDCFAEVIKSNLPAELSLGGGQLIPFNSQKNA
ncbi:LysR family transcriptional regulator [Marinilongibacter aquaticus]|uniref:LysR substrate-binding domain-containing protein n=1 Tax=Marinilongibacter aquaticus TaxID=2975157 RepID=UPI0021BD3E93|nr:LysR substrate-binding domain-containing protein [Marinilongibacter aquaticus]UBM58412.1 LysR family transcriptional regulator [Marinilongibacter aquaticus]